MTEEEYKFEELKKQQRTTGILTAISVVLALIVLCYAIAKLPPPHF